MTDAPQIHIPYLFDQQVEVMSRESERTAEVVEKFTRTGLLFVVAGIMGDRWTRELSEIELSELRLAQLRKETKVSLEDLRARAESKPHAVEVGPGSIPLTIESDRQNRGVSEGAPVQVDLVIFPTVLPSAPARPAEPGFEWKGDIDLRCGAGFFKVKYKAKILQRTNDGPRIEIVLDEAPISVTKNSVALSLAPKGKWTVDIAKKDGSPLGANGTFSYSMRAKLVRDGKPVDVEVLRAATRFRFQRIPAKFDETHFWPVDWK